MSKRIIITATCTANIEEMWTFDVPDDWQEGDAMENAEELLANTPKGCTYISCSDQVTGGETDREFVRVDTFVPDNAR